MPVSPNPKMIQYSTVAIQSRIKINYLCCVALNSSVGLAPTTLKGSAFQPLRIKFCLTVLVGKGLNNF